MFMVMAIMLVRSGVRVADVVGMGMTMGNMLACDHLAARLFAVAMAMSMIMAAMLVCGMQVARLFVVIMLMVMIMARRMLTCRYMLMVVTIGAVVGSTMPMLP